MENRQMKSVCLHYTIEAISNDLGMPIPLALPNM